MIQPQELRLGSWIKINGQVKQLNRKLFKHAVLEGLGVENIEPIPLTKEILLKCGFSDKEYKDGYIGIDVNSGGIITDFVLTKPLVMGDFQKSLSWEYRAGNIPFFNQIEHLHQLQNLFHSLTGTELEINL
jgi:hypothetical protein